MMNVTDVLLAIPSLKMIPFNFPIVFMSGNHADKGSEMMVLSKGQFISFRYHPPRCGYPCQ